MAELDKINVNGELYDMSDSKARSDIASEITNRTNADATLQTNIDNEANARTSADNALNQKIVQETTNRTNADNALQEKINTNKTGIDNLLNDVAARNVKAEEVTNVPEVKLPLDEVKEEIEAAGNRVLNSIPDDYTQINNKISELKGDLNKLEDVLGIDNRYITNEDLVFPNDVFVISNGSVVATRETSPYTHLAIKGNSISFNYKRRNSSYPLFVGVSVGGYFIGCSTNAVNSNVNKIDGTTNVIYSDATILSSIADDDYNSVHSYKAKVNHNVFSFYREETLILSFSVPSSVDIDGIAFLNYLVSTDTEGNADLTDVSIEKNEYQEFQENIKSDISFIDVVGNYKKHKIVAGVIRNSGDGWYFIVDENHQADLNCISVSANENGQIVIDYSGINATKVISLIMAPDETFSSLGYMVGCSVGLNKSYAEVYQCVPFAVSGEINCYSDGSINIDSNSVGITNATFSNGQMTVYHDDFGNAKDNINTCINIVPTSYGLFIPKVANRYSDRTIIEFYNATDGTKLTNVSGLMSFTFYRASALKIKRAKIDANDIVNDAGNFWFMGIFQTD